MEDNITKYKEVKPHLIKRLIWGFINRTVFRCIIGGPYTKSARNLLLRLFGAKMSPQACVYSSAIIFAPWNLEMGASCIGPHANIYNKDKITIEDYSVISQGVFLCTASHDISNKALPLITKPIRIKKYAWVASNSYVGMGVTIGEGAVVGATASVYKDVEPWSVVGGNPAKFIKKREIKS